MYGLLLESIAEFLRQEYGEAVWTEVRRKGDFTQSSFSTHDIYSENLIPTIARIASEITGESVDSLMDSFGVAFVSFVGQYGYDRILKVLGRHMRDFLNGLDNLHEYLRFSYSKLKPPSFFCENENKSGLTLHYRSRRKGFLHYVKGQIRQVGKVFYNTKVEIYVISEEIVKDRVHVIFRLIFDNTAYRESLKVTDDNIVDNIPLRSEVLFELFPFHIVFGRNMGIRSTGSGLGAVMRDVVGKNLTAVFGLRRPLVDFTWQSIMAHTNNVFELISLKSVRRRIQGSNSDSADDSSVITEDEKTDIDVKSLGEDSNCLHLKGQMMYMCEWDCIMFLGTPIMDSLDDMFNVGLYINDLSMHDSSRDLVLAGTQQSAELKLALDQEQEKSRLLEESMLKLDAEMKRTDALLYQMIPKPVADRLRRGEPSVNTCEVFDNVTILFSDVVGFTTICSQITPMEVVSMLNAMYTKFDKLSEEHRVYKVETIGDAYMVVSGAPTVTKFHGLHICDMALGMLDSMWDLKDPSTGGNMKIRVGIHTGTTVAGVVGIKMPRYCLFGDTVNTASRMETSGQAMRIHISETTKKELEPYPYRVELRGSIEVKGKGSIRSYWLLSKDTSSGDSGGPKCPFASYLEDEIKKINKVCQEDLSQSADGSRSVYSPVSFEDIPKSTFNSPVHVETSRPAKTNNTLNNNEANKNVSREESPKKIQESRDTYSKPKDVGMIKNPLHQPNRPPSANSRGKKEDSEKPKSQTCCIV
ncbi:soluble guanylate cyclase 88E-like [Haliotis asinina]|uniref:soluble guanylate cyclase 88E-like n=1 Tax=Haliotis asinina TaxID=109174 RepID=UPI0035324438